MQKVHECFRIGGSTLNTPLGIFWSTLKIGLALMRVLALKKCKAGGKSALQSSSCFSFIRTEFSRCSVSVSTICPPICMEASSLMRASLWRGSGCVRAPLKKYKSRQVSATWGRCLGTAMPQTHTAGQNNRDQAVRKSIVKPKPTKFAPSF